MKTAHKKTQAAQVYFPVDLYWEIKLIAGEEDKPTATWIRDVVTKEVEKARKKRKPFSEMPTFSNWKSDDPYISEKIDEIVYDNP